MAFLDQACSSACRLSQSDRAGDWLFGYFSFERVANSADDDIRGRLPLLAPGKRYESLFMPDADGYSAPDNMVDKSSKNSSATRYAAILVIIGALIGGILAQIFYRENEPPIAPEMMRDGLNKAGLAVQRIFVEPLTGIAGYEIALPSCAAPVGVLPVPARGAEAAPTAFRYQVGDYQVSYLFRGKLYSEVGINYKLNTLILLSRAQALFEPGGPGHATYYFKIWSPSACQDSLRTVINAIDHLNELIQPAP